MKMVIAVQTHDGVLHKDIEMARKYAEYAVEQADEGYGKAITALAHQLAQINRYSEMSRWLDDNIAQLKGIVYFRDKLDAAKSDAATIERLEDDE